MNPILSLEETIHRPASQVWDVLTDWSSTPCWMSDVASIQADGDTQVGTQLHVTAQREDTFQYRITELHPGTKLRLRWEHGGVEADFVYKLAPVSDHDTSVTLDLYCTVTGTVWIKLTAPLLKKAIKSNHKAQIHNLKTFIEQM